MRDAFVKQLTKLAEADSNIFLVTADLGFGMFDEFAQRFPDQFLNVGVAEQNMIGISTGLGLEGRTVFTYSIANFATLRCLEQIRNDAAYHEVNLTVVASGGGFTYGALGMSHHATEDLAIMRALPGVKLIAPCTAWEAYHATQAASDTPGVCYLRIEKGGNVNPPFAGAQFKLGESLLQKNGNDVALIATGSILEECLEAAEVLEVTGVSTRVISMHTVKPIDEKAILTAAMDCQLIVSVEEHNRLGGLGGAIAEILAGEGSGTKLAMIALDDVYSSVVGDQKYLRNLHGLDADAIVYKVTSMLGV